MYGPTNISPSQSFNLIIVIRCRLTWVTDQFNESIID